MNNTQGRKGQFGGLELGSEVTGVFKQLTNLRQSEKQKEVPAL